jgi:hypothetical protein
MNMNRYLTISLVTLVLAGIVGTNRVQARGFGGVHAGGFSGGAMHAGGFGGAGGVHAGGFGGGAMHAGGFGGAGGVHAGGLSGGSASGFHAEGPRGGSVSGFDANRLSAGGSQALGARAGGIGGGSVSGVHAEGPRGGSVSGFDANRFSAGGARAGVGGLGGASVNRAPSRSNLNSFLGLPSDAGLHSVSRSVSAASGIDARRGAVEGPRGGVAVGGAVQGPLGGTAVRGAAVGPRGNVVGGRAARGPYGNAVGQGFAAGPRGLRTISVASLHTGATAVRQSFHGRDLYSGAWYTRYPGAWAAAGWGAGYAWRAATWDSLGSWFDYGNTEPVYYDYGNNITYQDNSVYVNGQDVGTAQEYYKQSQDLATTGAQTNASTDEQWMPLGVFALTKPDHSSASMTLQLAVNKAGVIRGNYTNTVMHETLPIHGSVDKKTQRACWTVGKNTKTVMETGLYNLTKDEAPALIHFGADRTEQWMLVRIKKDDQSSGDGSTSDGGK